MPGPPHHARYAFAYLIALRIGLACLTSWTPLTVCTANHNKRRDSSFGKEIFDRLSGARANENCSVRRPNLTQAYGNMPLSLEVYERGEAALDLRNCM